MVSSGPASATSVSCPGEQLAYTQPSGSPVESAEAGYSGPLPSLSCVGFSSPYYDVGLVNEGGSGTWYAQGSSTLTAAQFLSDMSAYVSVSSHDWPYFNGYGTAPPGIIDGTLSANSPYLVPAGYNSNGGQVSSPNQGWVALCFMLEDSSAVYAEFCFVVGMGAVITPMPTGYPTCSVSADAGSGVAVLSFSDGVASGDVRSVGVQWGDGSTGSTLAEGSGSVGHNYALPLPAGGDSIVVTWSTGEACTALADWFSVSSGSSTGNPTGTSGSSGTSTAPGSWDAASCVPSGWGLLDPVSIAKEWWCLLEGTFIPTSADISYLDNQAQNIPVVSSVTSAVNEVEYVFQNPGNAAPSFAAFSSSVGMASAPVALNIPALTFSAGGFSTLADIWYGAVALVFLFAIVFVILGLFK